MFTWFWFKRKSPKNEEKFKSIYGCGLYKQKRSLGVDGDMQAAEQSIEHNNNKNANEHIIQTYKIGTYSYMHTAFYCYMYKQNHQALYN